MAANLRATAARTLAQVLDGRSLNQVLPPALEQVDAGDRPLLQQLCYGSLRQGPMLKGLLSQLLDKPLKVRDRDVECLLLIGLYQLEATRIPEHAAVSETVAAATKLKKNWAKGLCNALLRRYLRERDDLKAKLTDAALAAHPKWLYKALEQHWPAQFQQIIASNNQQPPMTLRVNSRQVDREDYLQRLTAAGIDARPGALCPEALYLTSPVDVHALPGFADGAVSVQDEAAQLAARLVAAEPGERVLDACAAPGGKTCHILELQPGLQEMIAADADETRLEKVRDNLGRLKLDAQCLTADASEPTALAQFTPFDKILVDAPCSATGVIRRHPDIKALRRSNDIPALAQLQQSILTGLWPLLRPGGSLVYATCSVLPTENDAVIAEFIRQFSDASCVPVKESWGVATEYGRQLLPDVDGPDGLYYALLQKT